MSSAAKDDIKVLCRKVLQKCLALEHHSQHVLLSEQQITRLCRETLPLLANDGPMVAAKAPAFVVGDLHGQFFDLKRQLDKIGTPADRSESFVFLGDYVDRGSHSIETICFLLAMKILYPSQVVLLRGNHECSSVNRVYGFYDDCKRRYSIRLWKTFGSLFNHLPPAAVIQDKILCVHGGLSPDLQSLDQLRSLKLPTDVKDGSLLSDVLWSDPDGDITGWGENDRGVGFTFGPNVVMDFLKREKLELVCRAHQVVEDGYEFFSDRRLVTVFSAPNYCGEFDNAAGILHVDTHLLCKFIITKPAGIEGASTAGEPASDEINKSKLTRKGTRHK
eukprot:m.150037 g.150037  ORF g.150037 m.150037 type:complete len:333 (-) comp16306_c0_seq1:1294-2292(-)